MSSLQYQRSLHKSLECIPFPTGTRGALYFHQDPLLQPISGAIRFRICDSPLEFEQGSDLLFSSWRPWELPLVRIVASPTLHNFSKMLVEDGLVPASLVADIRQYHTSRYWDRSVYNIYALNQPLDIDLSRTRLALNLITPRLSKRVALNHVFYDRSEGDYIKPYSGEPLVDCWQGTLANCELGRIRIRIELSTLPEHVQSPCLVIRFLEYLTPLKCHIPEYHGAVQEPQIGELHMRRTFSGRDKLWTLPLDKRKDGAVWKDFIEYTQSYKSYSQNPIDS